ncbi:hypothetical protein [Dysgonomonas termitidis]|uniref:Uncharacterized protein n=1 Tax=Dysgonomonas termitidis TaxID=1516126 RepID=A0ABV9L1K2_9BACT
MGNENLLDDFTEYIENLCRKHVLIKHSAEKKHFVRLDNDELLQEGKANIYYPVVTMEKLTVSYTSQPDNFRKSRHVELMFLDHIRDAGDFNNIENVWTKMEAVAEDFIKKIRVDKRNLPFLKSLVMDNAELDYVENIKAHLWGVLLSFDINLPFDNCLDPDRFE